MSVRIVYIDDEPMLCENFVDTFQSEKVDIVSFTQPEEGIDEIVSNKPDLVFLDYRFPDRTGEDIARILDDSIPKVLISGDLSLSYSYQFHKVLAKPADKEEIQAIIDSIITAKGKVTY